MQEVSSFLAKSAVIVMDWAVVTTSNGDQEAVSFGATTKWNFCGQLSTLFGVVKLMKSTPTGRHFMLHIDGAESQHRVHLPAESVWHIDTRKLVTRTRGVRASRMVVKFGPGASGTGYQWIELTAAQRDTHLLEGIVNAQEETHCYHNFRGC